MKYKEEILEGFFIKRYKRFFVDIKIGAKVVTAYCPNTGSLLGLLNEGSKVLVAKVENSNAKLKYRLEAIKDFKTFVGINTFNDYIYAKNHNFSSGEIVTYSTTGTATVSYTHLTLPTKA